MPVYLFRHGEAFQIGEQGIKRDAERPLTLKGRKVTEEVCKGLENLGVKVDAVWYSPLVRARETAEILIEMFGVKKTEEKAGLADSDEEEDLFQELGKVHPNSELVLVGHQPMLGEWVSRLLAGTPCGQVDLGKSGVACMELMAGHHPPRGTLLWLMTAKQLRKLK
jgi:phosphohistidine phosphatase